MEHDNMTTTTQAHLDKSTGDIDFPLWVKAVGFIISIGTPLGITLVAWLAVSVVEIKADLKYATEDRFRLSQHEAYVAAQDERDRRQNERLLELERLHGRGPNSN